MDERTEHRINEVTHASKDEAHEVRVELNKLKPNVEKMKKHSDQIISNCNLIALMIETGESY